MVGHTASFKGLIQIRSIATPVAHYPPSIGVMSTILDSRQLSLSNILKVMIPPVYYLCTWAVELKLHKLLPIRKSFLSTHEVYILPLLTQKSWIVALAYLKYQFYKELFFKQINSLLRIYKFKPLILNHILVFKGIVSDFQLPTSQGNTSALHE